MKKPMFTAILIALVLQGVSTAYAQSVTDVDLGTLIREIDNNSARALQLYGNAIITTWGQVWELYNTNRQPAISIQTFFDTLIQEQNSSGLYLNEDDINLSVYRLDLEDNNSKRLTDFMDLNGQNVALMSITDGGVEYRMVYKIDKAWQILFFYRFFDRSKF